MVFVRQLLDQKEKQVVSVGPETPLVDVLRTLSDQDIGVVVVVKDGQVIGIFSERDFTRALGHNPRLSLATPVAELMTERVIAIHPQESIEACMVLMTEHRIRHLPVVEEGKLVGMISIGDVVKEVLSERDTTIRGLENYILGGGYNS